MGFDMYNMNNGMGGVYPQMQPQYYDPNMAYNQPYFGAGNPVTFNNTNMGRQTTAMTKEDLDLLKGTSTSIFNMNLEPIEIAKETCDHLPLPSSPNVWVLKQLNDGSGECFCERCKARMSMERFTIETLENAVHVLWTAWQHIKYSGALPPQFMKDFAALIALVQKTPKIYENILNIIDRAYNGDFMQAAGMLSPDVMFNSLRGYGGFNYYFQQPQQPAYIPYPGQQQPQYPMMQQQQYPMQQQQYPMQQQATNVSPMQIPYGYNSAVQNPYNNQIGNMMPQNPYQQQTYTPVAQQQQPQQPQPYVPSVGVGSADAKDAVKLKVN